MKTYIIISNIEANIKGSWGILEISKYGNHK